VPYVDIVALILFISFSAKLIFLYFSQGRKISMRDFPLWFFMLLFALSGALSLTNVDREYFNESLKYLIRPICFFYLFIFLPFNIIDDFKKLFQTYKIMFVLGIILSLMGVWSLIFPPFTGIRQAVPLSIFGVWPLGTNHNSLAEILICLIPIALILFWQEKDIFIKNLYLLGALLMTAVNLLTLSRGGWLALMVELLILLILKYRESTKRFLMSYLFYMILLLIAPILFLMYQLMTSTVIVSSNLSRLKLAEIAINVFKQYPLIGAGVGTFIGIVAQTTWYVVEYGNPLDAHGFIFKTMAETGILGTLSFLAILGSALYLLTKGYIKNNRTHYSWLILGVLLMAVGDITFQLFSTNYYIARFWLPLGLALTTLKLADIKFLNQKIAYGRKS